jgi:hypothetical protein
MIKPKTGGASAGVVLQDHRLQRVHSVENERTKTAMHNALVDYFRCPDQFVRLELDGVLSSEMGYFQFAPDTICWGQYSRGIPAEKYSDSLLDASKSAKYDADCLWLPFDLSQVVDNLRLERYCSDSDGQAHGSEKASFLRKLYYSIRPVLGISIRKHLQRLHLRGWDEICFPNWPVDFTVDLLCERVLALCLKRDANKEIPFIWFWPEGAPSCAMMTHDVEEPAGRDFCSQLMDLDESFAIKSAFQIVPEVRYDATKKFVDEFWKRGFELNIHDLNHDGALFRDREQFDRRAEQINLYAKEFGARGFRAGAMYRRQDWFEALDLLYDMSVPNVAHLEPQRGGCCTVMPYFIGSILELPLTTIQDYSLLHILGDYSIDLWKQQTKIIMERNGLISFIVHPDYIIERRARAVYIELLEELAILRENNGLWIALPGEIHQWWRNRGQMRLVRDGQSWKIEGPDADRARVAFASLKHGQVRYRLA